MDILINYYKNHTKIIIAVAIWVLAIIITFFIFRGDSVLNPAKNNYSEDPKAGINYALLYNQGKLFKALEDDEDRLMLIQKDMALFARTTRQEFNGNEKPIGFTFDDSEKIEDNKYTYHGHFYGVKDKYSIGVTAYDSGVVSLSITNTKDGTNIDKFLNLGGLKNKLIAKLPISSGRYSIRYLKSEDKIVTTFYLGYTLDDVSAAIALLEEGYEGNIKYEDIIFNVNSIGRFDIEGIKSFSSSPENKY